MKQNVKRLPYGINDFEAVIEQNQYYVDKTMYLPLLENQPSNIIFIRPRRFGKSIFLSMLHAYYDCSKKEKFQTLFGDLWVGKHPTPLQGRYQVLHLDFSYVGGSIEKLEENFNVYLRVKLDGFMRIYKDSYPEDVKEKFFKSDSAAEKLALLQDETATKGIPLYLIIDEYDNFTNTVLNEQGEKVYWAITHADGFYRDVFKKFKGMFERIFITGVSPVTLDDVTSGFNIGWHISTKPEFNQMLGFSLEEVRKMFAYYKEVGGIPATSDIEVMIDEMKPWYDNYCFSEDALHTQSKVFNSDMVIYYLRNYIDRGESPKQMIDPNTMTDYNKMKKLLLLDKLDGNRKGINGMLTIKDTFGDMLILGIPNNNVRKQYYGYLLEQYQEEKFVDLTQMKILFTGMALEGKWRDALETMAKAYEDVSSVRDGIELSQKSQQAIPSKVTGGKIHFTIRDCFGNTKAIELPFKIKVNPVPSTARKH